MTFIRFILLSSLLVFCSTNSFAQPSTARSMWDGVLAMAQDSAADAHLVVVHAASSLNANGTADFWQFEFRLPESGNTIMFVAQHGNPDTITVYDTPGLPSTFHPLPFNFVDSPIAIQTAEENGGSAYRLTHSDVTFRVLAATWPSEDTLQGEWCFTYESPGNESLTIFVDFVTGEYLTVNDKPVPLPRTPQLNPNYPNPFNATTTISFELPTATNVRLTVYDNLGRIVANPVNGFLSAGAHSIPFSAAKLPSGSYYYRLQNGKTQLVRMMTLLK